MNELCVPVPGITDNDIAEVTVVIKGKLSRFEYRIESFPWDAGEIGDSSDDPLTISLARIYKLKQAIESYDKDWEIIQIFNPAPDSDHIHVLYRRRQ